jgi:hypothetical protein
MRNLGRNTLVAVLLGMVTVFSACMNETPVNPAQDSSQFNTTEIKGLNILKLNSGNAPSLQKIVTVSDMVTVQDGGELNMSAGSLENPLVIQPVAVAYVSSELAYYNRYAVNTINNTGMSADPADKTCEHGTFREDMWITTGSTTGTIVYDLGGVYNLTEMLLWNYNETSEGKTARGVRDVEILVSADSVYSSANFVSVGMIEAAEGGMNVQVFETIAPHARLVKLNILSNHGYHSYVGLSEIRFKGAAASAGAGIAVNFNVLPCAVQQDIELEVSTDDELLLADVYLTFGPHGTIFNPPAILNVIAFGLDLSGIDPAALNVYYDNQDSGEWELMDSTQIIVQPDKGYIRVIGARLPHFSRYAIGME